MDEGGRGEKGSGGGRKGPEDAMKREEGFSEENEG